MSAYFIMVIHAIVYIIPLKDKHASANTSVLENRRDPVWTESLQHANYLRSNPLFFYMQHNAQLFTEELKNSNCKIVMGQ